MKTKIKWPLKAALPAAALAGAMLGVTPADAHVTSIVIDSTAPGLAGASVPGVGTYTLISGRAFGELDRKDPHNAVIQDIDLADRDGSGQVPYIATFQLLVP